MKYKLAIVDEIEAPVGVTDMGNYNNMPAPVREIDVYEYASMMKHYSPLYIEHRQITTGVFEHRDVTIYWFDECGVANQWPATTGAVKRKGKWTMEQEEIHYYYIGCDHKFVTISQKECENRQIYHAGYQWGVRECTKCGVIQSYDTSG